MESTKAQIQGVVQKIYDAVIANIPKDAKVDLVEGEEVIGFFGMFFTSAGSRGIAVGSIDDIDVASYLQEVYEARLNAVKSGKEVITSEDIEEARNLKKGAFNENDPNLR